SVRPEHSMTTVVQMSHLCQAWQGTGGPKHSAVSLRCAGKNGVTRGRVIRSDSSRETKNADSPDVVWEGEFSDAAMMRLRLQMLARLSARCSWNQRYPPMSPCPGIAS